MWRGMNVSFRDMLFLQSDVKLAFEGQETTAFRFKLDGHGSFEAGSMNRIHKNLRNAGGAKQ